MSDSYYEGDAISFSSAAEGDMDLECGNDDCLREQSVITNQEYSHGVVTWVAEWICSSCGESNSREGWFDPNDNN